MYNNANLNWHMYEPVIDTWEGAYLMICLYYFKGASFSEESFFEKNWNHFEKNGISLNNIEIFLKKIGKCQIICT